MFRYARVLLASCKVHPLTLNDAKKSHTMMQRSERWEQVKWTQCSESTCFFKRDSRVRSSIGWINQIFAMSFYVSFALLCFTPSFVCSVLSVCSAIRGTVTRTYKRILSFVQKRAERFQWERICKRRGAFFYLRRRSPQGDGWRTRNGAKLPNTRGLSVIEMEIN